MVALLFASLVFGVMYLGPTFATVQRLVTSRERALGAALLLLVINLIGLGLGPWLVVIRPLHAGRSEPGTRFN